MRPRLSDTRHVPAMAFPSTPDPSWSPEQLVRWETARAVAATLTGPTDRFGWTVTTTGRIPGTGRALAATAATLMGAVPVTHLLTDVMGRVPASYTAVGMATAVMVAGARYTLRADVDNHPPVVAADQAPAERITATENYKEALS